MKEQFPGQFGKEDMELVEVVVNLSSADYRLWTMETLALLDWMRKFAERHGERRRRGGKVRGRGGHAFFTLKDTREVMQRANKSAAHLAYHLH